MCAGGIGQADPPCMCARTVPRPGALLPLPSPFRGRAYHPRQPKALDPPASLRGACQPLWIKPRGGLGSGVWGLGAGTGKKRPCPPSPPSPSWGARSPTRCTARSLCPLAAGRVAGIDGHRALTGIETWYGVRRECGGCRVC
jgi:hypothetical protein